MQVSDAIAKIDQELASRGVDPTAGEVTWGLPSGPEFFASLQNWAASMVPGADTLLIAGAVLIAARMLSKALRDRALLAAKGDA